MSYVTDAAKEYMKKKIAKDAKNAMKNDELNRLKIAGKEYTNIFDNKIYPVLNELYYVYMALADTDERVDEDMLFDVIENLDISNLNLAQYVSNALNGPSSYEYDEDESKVEKYTKLIKTKADIQKYIAPYVTKLTDALKSIPTIFRKNGFNTAEDVINAETKHQYYISYNIDFKRLYETTPVNDSTSYHDLYVQMQLDYDKALGQIDKIIADFWKKYPDAIVDELYEHGDFGPGDLDWQFKSDMGYPHNGTLTKEEAIAEADDKGVK